MVIIVVHEVVFKHELDEEYHRQSNNKATVKILKRNGCPRDGKLAASLKELYYFFTRKKVPGVPVKDRAVNPRGALNSHISLLFLIVARNGSNC